MNLSETWQVDPEHLKVVLKQIHFWYKVRKHKHYFMDWYNTVIKRPSNKKVEFKFMKEIKSGYYFSMVGMDPEIETINLYSVGFGLVLIMIPFPTSLL